MMQAVWQNSPVTEAIAKVLEVINPTEISKKYPKQKCDYLIVSYNEDFAWLWRFDDNLVSWLGGLRKTILLVWDQTPHDERLAPVNVSDYLTAVGWAVALSLTHVQRRRAKADGSAKKEEPTWRLIVLDLASKQHSSSDTVRLFRRLQENKPILPWVSFFGPAQLNESLWALQHKPEPHPEQSDVDLLRRLWIGTLTRPSNPGDRHAITNLMGPEVLLSRMDSAAAHDLPFASSSLSALRNLMRCLGLVVEQDREEAPWVSPDEWKESDPQFILLDDLAGLGWADFLKQALGIPKGDDQRFAVFTRPDAREFGPERNRTILEMLRDENGKLRIKQGLQLVPGDEMPILFLDLRLFSGRTDDEMKFSEDLLALAQQVEQGETNINELSWPGFNSGDLKAVERCTREKKIECDEYYIALTLLPRLIALVDPPLPIGLFSSTGRRRIAVALKDYGNVITEFDKPRLFGDVSRDVVGEVRVRFESALKRALSLARGRKDARRPRGRDRAQPRSPVPGDGGRGPRAVPGHSRHRLRRL